MLQQEVVTALHSLEVILELFKLLDKIFRLARPLLFVRFISNYQQELVQILILLELLISLLLVKDVVCQIRHIQMSITGVSHPTALMGKWRIYRTG